MNRLDQYGIANVLKRGNEKWCLDCEVFLRTHPTLRQLSITEIKDRKHITSNGKKLHKAMLARLRKITE